MLAAGIIVLGLGIAAAAALGAALMH
jgi:hypothetical protein